MVRSAAMVAMAAVAVVSTVRATPVEAPAAWTVTVRNPGQALGETPILVEVSSQTPADRYQLKPLRGEGPSAVAQVYADGGKTYLAAVLPAVAAQSVGEYKLTADPSAKDAELGVSVRPAGPNLEVFVGGRLLTVYRTDLATKPYYYPLIGPTGESFTRAYPTENVEGEARDHPHQRSFWFTHGSVNGLDFWASDPINKPNAKFGTIKETSRPAVVSGPALGLIRTTDDWLGPDGKPVCSDERVLRVYATAKSRIIDVDVTVKASAGRLTFGDTKEGTFGLRVASSMDVKNKTGGKITNAEGLTDDAAWGKASPWVDYTGPLKGKTVGVAILNHPESLRFPTTWHVRTYGLFAANPFGWHDFGRKESGDLVVEPGQSVRFRYRVVLHNGTTDDARIADGFRAYARPPVVEVKAD